MVNEWTKVELYGANNDGDVRRYTIADGTSISKGQLLTLTDPRTVTAATTNSPKAGVAAEEHLANVGVTSISAWTNGIFEAKASGAISIGMAVVGVAANCVCASSAIADVIPASGAYVIGYALETADADETINVRLRL